METNGNPVIYGELLVPDAQQTLMFYVHYDGQPVNPGFGSVVTFQSGEGLDSVLEGFTITNGTGTEGPQGIRGGGIYCVDHSSPRIRNNIIIHNEADYLGGGVFLKQSDFCWFTHNIVVKNYGG